MVGCVCVGGGHMFLFLLHYWFGPLRFQELQKRKMLEKSEK